MVSNVNLNGSTSEVNSSYGKTNKSAESTSSEESKKVLGTTEDEYAEVAEGEEFEEEVSDENSSDSNTTSDSTSQKSSQESMMEALMLEQQLETEKLARIVKRANTVMQNKAELQNKINAIADFDTQSELQSKLDGYSSTINNLEGQVSSCMSNLQNISSKMSQLLTSSSSTTGTTAATGTATGTDASGVSGTSAATGVAAVSSTSAPEGYNAERGQALVNAAKSLYGDNPYSGGMCGYGVSCSIAEAFGESVGGNGCDYKYLLEGRSGWKNVTSQYPTVESLDNLPAGAVVSWDPYNTTSAGSIYGHVYIADGNGGEISDFYATTAGNSHYADGGGWTVFIPV